MLSSARPRSQASLNLSRKRSQRILMEALEQRELLSSTLLVAANGKSATFTDVDGDIVTVAITKGTLNAGLFTTAASGLGDQLQELDLSGAGFSGTNLTISVKQTGTGNGLTNVGYIHAGTNSLGKTIVSGDLGRIDAGSSPKSGITSLSVFSLGAQGTTSQAAGGTLVSTLTALGSLAVTTDINGAFVNVTGNIGNVTVGESLIGTTDANSGSIQSASGNIGNVFIGQNMSANSDAGAVGASYSGSIAAHLGSIGNVTVIGSVIGGAGNDSAEIYAYNKIGKVIIGGSVIGGGGQNSGEIDSFVISSVSINGALQGGGGKYSGSVYGTTLGNVSVGGSLVGGAGQDTGAIGGSKMANIVVGGSLIGGDGVGAGSIFPATLNSLTVGGSIVGGAGADSGALFASSSVGKIVVNGSLVGGDYVGSGNATDSFYSGYIESLGKITSVFIGGNVTAGVNGTAAVLESGTIRAGTTLGSVQINGNLMGSATQNAIIAAGTVGKSLGSVVIGGSVTNAQILAGYVTNQDTNSTVGALMPISGGGGAQIGSITVRGNWTASSVMAGTAAGADTLPGTIDDVPISGAGAGKGSIQSILIFGQVFGTAGGGDNFGFVSSSIGSFSAAGVKAPLTKGKDSIVVWGTNDVTILEVSVP